MKILALICIFIGSIAHADPPCSSFVMDRIETAVVEARGDAYMDDTEVSAEDMAVNDVETQFKCDSGWDYLDPDSSDL